MGYITAFPDPVPNGTLSVIRVSLVDEEDAAIADGDVTTVVYSLFAIPSGVVVNSRENVDASAGLDNGILTITVTALDNALLDATNDRERRLLWVKWTWGSGGVGKHEVRFVVQQSPPAFPALL